MSDLENNLVLQRPIRTGAESSLAPAVILVGNYVHDAQESMQRFTNLLCKELDDRGLKVRVMRPLPLFGTLRRGAHGAGKWLGYIDKLLIFPWTAYRADRELATRAGRATVAHICDHSNGQYSRCFAKTPHLVTCHDLLAIRCARGEFPEQKIAWSGRRLQSMIGRGLKHANSVACVSRATKRDVVRVIGKRADDVEVVYNGLNYNYSPLPRDEARASVGTLAARLCQNWDTTRATYLLHVGGNHWYKNRQGVLRIYAELHAALYQAKAHIPKLVLVGPPIAENLWQKLPSSIKGDVVVLSTTTNEQLRALYSAAEALLFPSIEEGFGWPLIEAQACGCRVLTTRKAPMTEVAGDAASYLSPEEVARSARWAPPRGLLIEAVRTLRILLGSRAEERGDQIKRGLLNVRRFATNEMIDRYLAIYQRLTAKSFRDSFQAR